MELISTAFATRPLPCLRDVARHFASAGGVADVNGVFQIKRLRDFGDVARISIHVVPFRGLRGAAVPTAIVSDDPVSVAEEEHHLRVPVVGREWPSVMEEERLAASPILEVNFGAVFYFDGVHFCLLVSIVGFWTAPKFDAAAVRAELLVTENIAHSCPGT